jgi:hypothetical protein
MKKIVFLVFLSFIVCGITFAQTTTSTTSVINGILGLNGGRIVLRSGDTTYYTRDLEHFVGFIDGLKEGVQVTIEGYVSSPSLEGATERLLFPVKLTLNGKVYEVGPTMAGGFGWKHPMVSGRMGRGVSRRHGW